MQAERRTRSVAEQKVRSIIEYQQDDDLKLVTLLEVWCTEQEVLDKAVYDADRERWAKEWCFGTFVTLRANWCVEQCSLIPAGKYPKSRKFLAIQIADGLLGTRDQTARERFAQMLATWSADDGKIPADAWREMTEFRWPGRSYDKERMPAMLAFCTCLAKKPAGLNEEVVRTVLKSAGTWAPLNDLVFLAGCLAANGGPARQPLNDLVRHAIGV